MTMVNKQDQKGGEWREEWNLSKVYDCVPALCFNSTKHRLSNTQTTKQGQIQKKDTDKSQSDNCMGAFKQFINEAEKTTLGLEQTISYSF